MSGITVSGRGEATGTPDTLLMSLGVSVLRRRVSEAAAIAAERLTEMIGALEARGVDRSDMHTTSYSICPQWDHRDDEPRITGYRVDSMLSVTFRDVSAAGDLIDTAVSAGGDEVRISNVTFSIEDDRAVVAAARAAAWQDAAAKAEQLAELAGVTLGAPTAINESFGQGPAPMLRAAVMEHTPSPVTAGNQQVSVDLTVVFAIAD